MSLKKITFFAIVCSILFPLTANAIDQRCFTRSECIEERRDLMRMGLTATEAPEDGFIRNSESTSNCPSQMYNKSGELEDTGFCIPVGQADTTIKISGRTGYANIAEYIQYLYRYSMIIAGILAVMMLIISGIQWTLSGGNPERISSAKKRITGAVLGLLLLAGSYTILITINPALVNLRLPQIFMLRGIELASLWCDQLPGGSRIAQISLNSEGRPPDFDSVSNYDFSPNESICGNYYFVAGSGGQVCRGRNCSTEEGGDRQRCVPYAISGNRVVEAPYCAVNNDLIIHYKVDSLEQYFLGSAPGALGALVVKLEPDDPGWLSTVGVLFVMCRYPQGHPAYSGMIAPGYEIGLNHSGAAYNFSGSSLMDIHGAKNGSLHEYIVNYKNIAAQLRDFERRHDFCNEQAPGSDIDGFFIKNEVDGDWDWDESNLFLKPKNQYEVFGGNWLQVSPWAPANTFAPIPYFKLSDLDNNARFYEFDFTGDIISDTSGQYHNCEPANYSSWGTVNIYLLDRDNDFPPREPQHYDCD